MERGGWFGSLVGLDEGVGREGEEEFDEGKEGMAKKGRGEEDNKHLRWQLSPAPSESVDRPLSSEGDCNARNG